MKNKKQNPVVPVMFEAKMKKQLEKLAKKEGRTFAGQVRHILAKSLACVLLVVAVSAMVLVGCSNPVTLNPVIVKTDTLFVDSSHFSKQIRIKINTSCNLTINQEWIIYYKNWQMLGVNGKIGEILTLNGPCGFADIYVISDTLEARFFDFGLSLTDPNYEKILKDTILIPIDNGALALE